MWVHIGMPNTRATQAVKLGRTGSRSDCTMHAFRWASAVDCDQAYRVCNVTVTRQSGGSGRWGWHGGCAVVRGSARRSGAPLPRLLPSR